MKWHPLTQTEKKERMRRVKDAYRRPGATANLVSKETGIPYTSVREIARSAGVAHVGKPGVPPEEVLRRKDIAATCLTWAEYAVVAGLADVTNPKQDRRLGVRLLCWKCRTRVSSTAGYVDGLRRALCGRCKKAVG